MHGPDRTWGRLARAAAPRLAAGTLLAGFLLLKCFALWPAVGDENIYFYMATRVARGVLPWREFFFAHPPLHLVPGTLLALITDFHLPLFKAIPAAAAALCGTFLWRSLRHISGSRAGLLGLFLLLFSYDFLRASSHYTGVNVGLALLAAALDAALRRRDRLAGGLLAGAAGTALYLAPVGIGLALARFLEDRRAGWRLAASGLSVFAAINLLGLATGGSSYLAQVYAYHLAKPHAAGAFGGAIASIALTNPLLLASPLAAASAWALGRLLGRSASATSCLRLLRFTALPLVIGLVFLASLSRVFHFYFLPLFPFLALAGGFGLSDLLRSVGGALRARPPRAALARAAFSIAALGLTLLAADGVRALGLAHQPWVGKVGTVRHYSFQGSPLPDGIDALVRRTLWRDERRIGARVAGVTRYLWHESRIFRAAEPLVQTVTQQVPPGPLFGDSTSTPLIALLSGRRIAADEVDTNIMRFKSGATTLEALFEHLQSDPPAALLLHPGRGIATLPGFQTFARLNYRLLARHIDPYQGPYEVWVRQ
ncbi:MAG: hypothetical protein D6729_18495 [Deltaproteobacteria bacterium]|nr:MAG: hypothetical protein D6729_18495 [Deltaproteobacteria bacterium]